MSIQCTPVETRSRQYIENKRSMYEKERSELRDSASSLCAQLRDIDKQKEFVRTTIPHQVREARCNLIDIENEIRKFENRREMMVESLKKHARLRSRIMDIPIAPDIIYEDDATKRIDAELSSLNIQLKSINDELTRLSQIEKDVNSSYKTVDTIKNNIVMLDQRSDELAELIDECNLMINEMLSEELKARYREKYISYALAHNIKYENDNELFSECNQHHQRDLLENSNNGKGWYSNRECPWPSDEDGMCNGWYYNNRRCECGNYKGFSWNDDNLDEATLYEFNIESQYPYGEFEMC